MSKKSSRNWPFLLERLTEAESGSIKFFESIKEKNEGDDGKGGEGCT